MTVGLVRRPSWRARRAGGWATVPASSRDALVVHYLGPRPATPAREGAQRLREADAYHVDVHGWNGLGYNLAVDQAGHAYEGRGWDAVGAHRDGWNRRAWGVVCLIGGDERPSEQLLDTLAELVREARVRAGKPVQLLGHGEHGGATACPGPRLLPVVQSWRQHLPPPPSTTDPQELDVTRDELRAELDRAVVLLTRGDNPDPVSGDTHPDNIGRLRTELAELRTELRELRTELVEGR